MGTFDASPPLVRHQGLRKRGIQSNGYASGHLSASATHSVARRSVSASAYVNARPTRSASHSPSRTHDLLFSLTATISAPSSGAKLDNTSTKAS